MPDYAAQRRNMVEAQIRANDVTDTRIQSAMDEIARERFVPASKRAVAYADVPVEVVAGRYLMDPRSFAKLVQLAAIAPADTVLDVGCATGYSTAVLARLAKSVVALEQDADLVRIAIDMLQAVKAPNAEVVQGSLADGCKAKAPYDVIFVNGAIESEPAKLLSQLGEGGRLVAIMRNGDFGRAQLFMRRQGHIGRRADFDASVPLLAGFRAPVGFVF
jgi:protein-L-isoaspartate(D-aspartate) O-methyltransferase